MASEVTYGELRDRAKFHSDMVHSDFVSDADWLMLINASASRFYNMLVEASEDFYNQRFTISLNGRDSIYRLPDDFYKLRGVDYPLNGKQTPMKKFNFRDRHRGASSGPPPATTVTLWVVPKFVKFESDSDTFDGVNGWEEWIALDAAKKALSSEESDISGIMVQQKEIEDAINAQKKNRDIGEPEVVGDVYRDNCIDEDAIQYMIMGNEIHFKRYTSTGYF